MENNIIYSDSFKQWFGDWENNPQTSSKVVDENGLPLVVYHGTENEFDEFKSKFMGQTGTRKGQGFYFTAYEKFAQQFGKNVKAYYLNIRKPLSSTELTITREQLSNLLDNIDKTQSQEEEGFEYGILSDYGDVDYEGRDNVLRNAVELEINSSDNDVELIGGIINTSGNYDMVVNFLFKTLGYDGIIVEEDKIYIAHHPNQIKEITNQTFSNNSMKTNESINKKRIFVTESQFNSLTNLLKEERFYIDTQKVLIVKKYLDKNFSRGSMDSIGADGYPKKTNVIGMKDNKGEVFKNMTFEQMLDLLEDKFHTIYTDKNKRSKFLNQVLKDWFNKKISNEGLLSVNHY